MANIFIGGAFFTTQKEDTDIFPYIVKIIKDNYKNIDLIQPTDIEDYRKKIQSKSPNITLKDLNKSMVDYDLEMIRSCKLMIADVTNKSTGLGIELGIIKQNNIPIELVARKNAKISNMIFGAFPECNIYYYDTLDELKNIIITIVEKYKDTI